MTDLASGRPSASRRPSGPHPGALVTVALVLTIGGILSAAIMSGGAALASPFATSADVAQHVRQSDAAIRLLAWTQVGAAIPLGIASATFYARQVRLGIRVPGPSIGQFGGTLASVMLLMTGIVGWVLSRPEIGGDAALLHALSFLSFTTGSVGFVLGMGLLIAGIAVPGLILRLLPRWLAWTGLVIAVCSELSFFAMLFEPLQFLFAIGRFGGLLWLVVAGFLLPANRPRNATQAVGTVEL
jgi:hypothetical protein